MVVIDMHKTKEENKFETELLEKMNPEDREVYKRMMAKHEGNSQKPRSISEIKEMLKRIEDREDDYACNICDALSWVLGEISTEDFTNHFLDL